MPTRNEFMRRIAALQKIADREDDQRLGRVLDLIGEANKEIIRRLRSAGRFEAAALGTLRGEITQVINEMVRQMNEQIGGSALEIVESSTRQVAEPLGLLRIQSQFGMIPRSLIDTYQDFTTNLISGIGDEARAAIAREVGLGAIGAKKKSDVIDAIGSSLDGKGVFPSIAHRARVITNTETKRLRAQAKQVRQEQAAKMVPGMKKWWLTVEDGRVRASHRMAGMIYSIERAIPVNQKFIVGGFRADYPRDASLPAKESVECRCESVIALPDRYFEGE